MTIAPPPKTQTEYKRRVRSILYSDAVLAVEWLNEAMGTPSYTRVLRVRQELEALGTMLAELRKRLTEGRARFIETSRLDLTGDLEYGRLAERFHRRHNALNRLLSPYAHVPAFAYSIKAGVWHFGMVPKRSRGPEIKVDVEHVPVRMNESSTIAALARLAANRELHKVRLCEQCRERWLVSERQIDRFHNQQCRDAYHAKSPGYHDRKAANQRAYRQRVRQGLAAGANFK